MKNDLLEGIATLLIKLSEDVEEIKKGLGDTDGKSNKNMISYIERYLQNKSKNRLTYKQFKSELDGIISIITSVDMNSNDVETLYKELYDKI